jgi:hypothetical protein
MDARTQTNFWDRRIVPEAALTVYFIVCSLLLHPYDNLPFVDDWTYAWSVEQLLKTGELHISDWSAHYPLAQILWGALFCRPFGFSFSALPVSTVVLAWLGALAFYASSRGLGRRPRPDSPSSPLSCCWLTQLASAGTAQGICDWERGSFRDAVASIHPFGRTARPQVVQASWRCL